MLLQELSKELERHYEIGKQRKECNALVQCFGIKFADVIKENNRGKLSKKIKSRMQRMNKNEKSAGKGRKGRKKAGERGRKRARQRVDR